MNALYPLPLYNELNGIHLLCNTTHFLKWCTRLLAYHHYSYKTLHDGIIKWKHFSRYWPFVRGIHRSPVNCPHKGHWRGALMFSLIYARMNGWINNREAGDLRRHRAHYYVTVMGFYNATRWCCLLLLIYSPLNGHFIENNRLTTFVCAQKIGNHWLIWKIINALNGLWERLWPLLLTWFNFNPSMDK